MFVSLLHSIFAPPNNKKVAHFIKRAFDKMQTKYFTPGSESELKAQYVVLYKANFKDVAIMAAINSELKAAIETANKPLQPQTRKAKPLSEETNQAIAKAAIFAKSLGLKTELVGSWLWCEQTERSKAAKEQLKAFGFHWTQKHNCWRFTTDKYFKIRNHKTKPEIYTKYQATEI